MVINVVQISTLYAGQIPAKLILAVLQREGIQLPFSPSQVPYLLAR